MIPFTINDSDKFIILASDGVWEFIDNQEVMNFMIPFFKLNDTE